MANNRYYMLCPCGDTQFLGKSLADCIYSGDHDELQDWMWEHLMTCPSNPAAASPYREWHATNGGEPIFTVITEYDRRAPGGYMPRTDADHKT